MSGYNEQREAQTEKSGVAVWLWIFWLVVCFPVLIVVAIVHTGRKNRHALRLLREVPSK